MAIKKILITNDDGIDAKGLRALVDAFAPHYELLVVAPAVEQSGKSHSFTYKTGVRCRSVDLFDGVEAYSVDGTPSDCVKVAFAHLRTDLPDLVLSGINCGENLGIANFYSGTVGAAREALFWHVPAVAFSTHYESCDEAFQYGHEALKLIEKLDSEGLLNPLNRFYYNVNFPACPPRESKGFKLCKQSLAYYNDRYTVARENGEEVLYVNGTVVDVEESLDYDVYASNAGYTTLTPLSIDATAYEAFAGLEALAEQNQTAIRRDND